MGDCIVWLLDRFNVRIRKAKRKRNGTRQKKAGKLELRAHTYERITLCDYLVAPSAHHRRRQSRTSTADADTLVV